MFSCFSIMNQKPRAACQFCFLLTTCFIRTNSDRMHCTAITFSDRSRFRLFLLFLFTCKPFSLHSLRCSSSSSICVHLFCNSEFLLNIQLFNCLHINPLFSYRMRFSMSLLHYFYYYILYILCIQFSYVKSAL